MEQANTTYQHVYQNTVQGVLLFYDNTDKIIFFTILSVLSERYGVRIIAMSLMPDHYHLLVEANNRFQIVDFIRTLNSVYAKAFNRTMNRKGRIFNKEFGCAPKRTIKEIMSTVNYILNNPLVKMLDKKVENSRWNYLPYALSKNPFSATLRLDAAKKNMRTAVKAVNTIRKNGRWMTYRILEEMSAKLDDNDTAQLEDYIVSSFFCIDYEAAAFFYGSTGNMINAANCNSGSEYMINEMNEVKDDRIYVRMLDFLRSQYHYSGIKEVLRLDYEQRLILARELLFNMSFQARQIEKYLHLPDGTLYEKKSRVVRVSNHYRHLPLAPGTCRAVGGQVPD